jgi:hypothetical protein
MPENSTGQIAIYQDLAGVPKFTFSPQVTGVRLSKIPAATSSLMPVGTLAVLPGDPSDGDSYTLEDTDGSCSVDNAIVVVPDPTGKATVGGIGGFPLFTPFAGGKFTFDAEANNWVVALTGNVALTGVLSKFGGGNLLTLGDLTSGTTMPIVLFAYQFNGKGGGVFEVDFDLTFTLSQADTVTITIAEVTDITAFSGGTASSSPIGTLRIETSGGGPVTVTGTEVQFGQWAKQVAAGEIAKQTASWSGLTTISIIDPNPVGLVARIVAATAGTSITGLTLSTSVRQVG